MNGPEYQSFERLPRRHRYLLSYIGHAAQGLVCALILGWLAPLVIVSCYLAYQRLEFLRAQCLRDAKLSGIPILDEWPSRDVADFMIGLWIGLPIGVAWQMIMLWHFIGRM